MCVCYVWGWGGGGVSDIQGVLGRTVGAVWQAAEVETGKDGHQRQTFFLSIETQAIAEGKVVALVSFTNHMHPGPALTVFVTPDLGLARTAESLLDSNVVTDMAGSAGYMAPEQYDGSFTSKVDTYALGVILNECLTGEPPFPFHSKFIQICHAVSVKGERPDMASDAPKALQKLIAMCWEAGPNQEAVCRRGGGHAGGDPLEGSGAAEEHAVVLYKSADHARGQAS